ncbi:interferon-induced, double-stranded RNA-activated protein kinase [Platysternon megacephalum]|uniref:Interferon-induced, double-stranded RNA-activated protein kinase n=1 Tax=Platysternon megacephalum TaxID=55544 RepID=A0A4D9EVP2_9SAUR|nr:interferon-induced, double-stranded RNA-activated protein kinase [Platysternon megacephalum]
MELSDSRTCLRTCPVKDCRVLHFSEKPIDPGQFHLSRSRSRRMMARRRSNSISMCTLPSIPEYPGFQDTKLSRSYSRTSDFSMAFQDLGRKRNSPVLRVENPTNIKPLGQNSFQVHSMGNSSGNYFIKGHRKTSSSSYDKTLQEYFNERLMELRNYETKRSNRLAKGYPDENEQPNIINRGLRRRSSCSAVILTSHMKEIEESCNLANQANESVIECEDQGETQNVLDFYTSDYLDILTMHINAPLEMFVRRK